MYVHIDLDTDIDIYNSTCIIFFFYWQTFRFPYRYVTGMYISNILLFFFLNLSYDINDCTVHMYGTKVHI